MSNILTRSTTNKMLEQEQKQQEEANRIEHFALLESTYEADLNSMCDTEIECYAQIERLNHEIAVLDKEIRNAYDAHDLRCKQNRPYDEAVYEASHQILCDIENKCCEQKEQLEGEIKMLESTVYIMNLMISTHPMNM